MNQRWLIGVVAAVFCITAHAAEGGASAATPAKVPSLVASPTVETPNTSTTQSPSQLKMDWASPLRVEEINKAKPEGINWSTVLSSLAAACVGLFGAVIVGLWTQRGVRRSLSQAVNAAELKDLQTKLDSFYGPYLQRSEINRLMIEEFRSHQVNPGQFRTLTLLLDPQRRSHLSKSDQTIVGEIVKNDIALNTLILKHTGLVDSQVMNYLSRAGAHFRLMELAFEGKLENDPKRFDTYVYPRQLDDVLRLEVKRLTDRCEKLRSNSTESTAAMPKLEIPGHLQLPPWTLSATGASAPTQ